MTGHPHGVCERNVNPPSGTAGGITHTVTAAVTN